MRGQPIRTVAAPVAVLLAAMLAAGCGATSAPRTRAGRTATVSVPIGARLTGSAPPSVSRHPLPAIGATQHVETEGAALSVTLRAVIDPLTGSGAILQPGTRAVAIVVQIRNAGPSVYDSSATGDLSVVPSSGTVMPVLARHGACKTPVEDFDRYISAGEDRVGCVVFAVADGATVNAVRFSPHARPAGRLLWSA